MLLFICTRIDAGAQQEIRISTRNRLATLTLPWIRAADSSLAASKKWMKLSVPAGKAGLTHRGAFLHRLPATRNMRLYFLRHADALDGDNDEARPLSPRGLRESRQIGEFLRRAGIEFDAAFSSPLVRAQETAEIVLKICGRLSPDRLESVDALRNEASQSQFDRWLKGLSKRNHVLLVGHAPALAERLCHLLGVIRPDGIKLSKASLACVEIEDRRPSLRFLVSPKILSE